MLESRSGFAAGWAQMPVRFHAAVDEPPVGFGLLLGGRVARAAAAVADDRSLVASHRLELRRDRPL